MLKISVSLLLCLAFLSCTTFKPVVKTSADIGSFQPIADKKYRIVMNNGDTIETRGSDIKVVDDNIYIGQNRSIPANDVSSIEIKNYSSLALLGGIETARVGTIVEIACL